MGKLCGRLLSSVRKNNSTEGRINYHLTSENSWTITLVTLLRDTCCSWQYKINYFVPDKGASWESVVHLGHRWREGHIGGGTGVGILNIINDCVMNHFVNHGV